MPFRIARTVNIQNNKKLKNESSDESEGLQDNDASNTAPLNIPQPSEFRDRG